MLRWRGYAPNLRLGVRRSTGERRTPIVAHAWVECDGVVVIGSLDDLWKYRELSPLLIPPAHEASSSRKLAALVGGGDVSWRSLGMSEDEFLEFCTREDLSGLVYQRVRGLDREQDWPGRVRDELAREVRAAVAAELIRREEIRAMLQGLGRAGIHPILFKGTPLAYAVYEAPALRPRADTDLLVRQEAVDAVRRVMTGRGYSAAVQSDGELVHRQFEMHKRDRFGLDHVFDVHWRISSQSTFADVLTYDDLSSAAEPVPALGPAARMAGPAEALLLACLHPVMHHRNVERVVWVYDIHLLASRLSADAFDRFVDLARRKKVAAIGAHGLELAHAWFGTRIPEAIAASLSAITGEPSAEYLHPSRRWRHELASNFKGLPRWRDRIRLAREVVFPSPQYMFGAYGFEGRALGLALLPALYLHRGLHGAWKVMAGRK